MQVLKIIHLAFIGGDSNSGDKPMNAASVANTNDPIRASVANKFQNLWSDLVDEAETPVDINAILTAVTRGRGTWGALAGKKEREALKALNAKIDDSPWYLESRKRFLKAAAVSKVLAETVQEECHHSGPSSADCQQVCDAVNELKKSVNAHDEVLGSILLIPEDALRAIELKYNGDSRMIAAHFNVPVEAVLLRRKWDQDR
jgi:hypothetical protein